MRAAFTHDSEGTPRSSWTSDPAWLSCSDLELVGGDESTVEHLVVVAAHPDDETLGAGGLLATAHQEGIEVDLVLVTAGEGSHPHSPTVPPQELAERRLAESKRALDLVVQGGRTTHLAVPDGLVAESVEGVVESLVRVIGDGRSTILLSPWSQDGHPDHEACGRAAEVAARRTGARLLQFPIWFWHWGAPAAMPWDRVRQLRLSPSAVASKRAAILAHKTQVAPLSPAVGDEQLLSAGFLAYFRAPVETFVEVEPRHASDPVFDDLHRDVPDPWGVDERWYEQRKRDLTLAVLPRPTYEHALELGSSTGALAADLAPRCRELLAVDASAAAVERATVRMRTAPGVRVERRDLPRDWPAGSFDLVVVSELGYFLSPVELDVLVEQVESALTPDGDLVLCHWRHPIQGWPLDGPAVHARVRSMLSRPEIATYQDRDFEICVFSRRATPEADA